MSKLKSKSKSNKVRIKNKNEMNDNDVNENDNKSNYNNKSELCKFCNCILTLLNNNNNNNNLCNYCYNTYFKNNEFTIDNIDTIDNIEINNNNIDNSIILSKSDLSLSIDLWISILLYLSLEELLKLKYINKIWYIDIFKNSPIWYIYLKLNYSSINLNNIAELYKLPSYNISCYTSLPTSKYDYIDTIIDKEDITKLLLDTNRITFAIPYIPLTYNSKNNSKLYITENNWFNVLKAISINNKRINKRKFILDIFNSLHDSIPNINWYTRWGTLLCFSDLEFQNSQLSIWKEYEYVNDINSNTNNMIADKIHIGSSKIGGLPDLPNEFMFYDSLNVVFYAQINFDEYSSGAPSDNPFPDKNLGILYLYAIIDPATNYLVLHPKLQLFYLEGSKCKNLARKSKFDRGFIFKCNIDMKRIESEKASYISHCNGSGSTSKVKFSNFNSLNLQACVLVGSAKLYFLDAPTIANISLEDSFWKNTLKYSAIDKISLLQELLPNGTDTIWGQFLGYFGKKITDSFESVFAYNNDWEDLGNTIRYTSLHPNHMRRNFLSYNLSRRELANLFYSTNSYERFTFTNLDLNNLNITKDNVSKIQFHSDPNINYK